MPAGKPLEGLLLLQGGLGAHLSLILAGLAARDVFSAHDVFSAQVSV
jgi:hypothetical protein